MLLFNERTRRLDEVAVAYTRWARRLAGAAAEAKIEMPHHVRRHRQRSLLEALHEIDAPARRIHFGTQLDVCRACRQAQPAVHAVEKLIVLDEARCGPLF